MPTLTTTIYVLTGFTAAGAVLRSEHPTEQAALDAAIAPGLAASPAGTTAEVGTTAVTIKFATDTRTLRLPIERQAGSLRLLRNSATMAEIHAEERPVVIEPPALDEVWAKDRPWSALQAAALDYAERVLPPTMLTVIRAVSDGRMDCDAVDDALGIRWRVLPLEFNDDADNPHVVDITPHAIRTDAHRAANLAWAWAPQPGYRPESAVRTCDTAYRARIHALCEAIQAEMGGDR